MSRSLILAGALALSALSGMAHAGSWTLDPEASHLAYGSIKKDSIGEVNSFSGLIGTVSPEGSVTVSIDLASVETWIDIRNERMIEHVFEGVAMATVSSEVDMGALESLDVGETSVIDAETVLSFVGTEVSLEAELLVARLSETRVMVTTNDMIFVSTEELGIDPGIDKLMELAGLPGITRTAPVTFRLVFEADEKKAEAAPAAADTSATEVAALLGDPAAGKKVYRKCRACHALDEGRNGVGPHLAGLMGRTAGAVDGFAYSEALAGSGLSWNAETLAAFLANPKGVVPGNKMAFPGVREAEDIQNLIAYLAQN